VDQSCHLDINISEHHDDFMRTTLTLERDVVEGLEKEMRRTRRGLKATINDALRRGLRIGTRPPKRPPFTVRPQALGIKAGIDLDRLNQLVDELDADERARTLRR
jgi:hypothetical protein